MNPILNSQLSCSLVPGLHSEAEATLDLVTGTPEYIDTFLLRHYAGRTVPEIAGYLSHTEDRVRIDLAIAEQFVAAVTDALREGPRPQIPSVGDRPRETIPDQAISTCR